jgi:polyphosphate kinase 2 (PPK2 family)
MQDWIQHTKAKIIVIFEGRDAPNVSSLQRGVDLDQGQPRGYLL